MEILLGYVLVLGDNWDNFDDGWLWGFVLIQNIKGKVLFIWVVKDVKDRIFWFVY